MNRCVACHIALSRLAGNPNGLAIKTHLLTEQNTSDGSARRELCRISVG